MKRILCILAAMMLLTGIFAMAEGSDWFFDTNDFKLTEYLGSGGEVVIPETIDGCTVDIIGLNLLNNNDTITSLTLSSTVRQIENGAVSFCSAMTELVIPEGVVVIGDNCFVQIPGLTEITIPATVRYIGNNSFGSNENLNSITFTGVCPYFAGEAFDWIADDAVIRVPDDQYEAYAIALAEAGCTAQVTTSGSNAVVIESEFDYDLFEFDAETGTIYAYYGYDVCVTVPEEIDGTPVKAIGDNAFYDNSYLCMLILPEGVEVIGESAFEWCENLLYVDFPSTLEKIEANAFNCGYKSYELTLPEGLEVIGENAFANAIQLSGTLVLPEGLTTIEGGAFSGCGWLEEVYVPATVETIGEKAFADCGVSYVVFEGLELPEIAQTAFENCWYLADIDLHPEADKQQMLDMQAFADAADLTCRVWRAQNPNADLIEDGLDVYENGVMTAYTGTQSHIRPYDIDYNNATVYALGEGVFKGNTSIEYFAVPHSDEFTTIGAQAFEGSTLKNIDLFDSVTTIGAEAFKDCSALTELTIPASVTSIGEGAFDGMTALEKVTILCDMSLLPEGSFADASALRNVYVGEKKLSTFVFTDPRVSALTAAEVERFAEMPYEPTSEEYFEFDADRGVITAYLGTDIDVVIPRTIGGVIVRGLDYNAFDCARDYTNTEVETNQTDWLRLRTVVLPETIQFIEDETFSYCQQLENVICYAPLDTTGRGAFLMCRGLKNVVFVNGVGMLDNYCLEGTESLQNVYYGEHLTYIGIGAINRSGIVEFVVDAEEVVNYAFNNNPHLMTLHFTDRCKTLEAGAVSENPSLANVCFEGSDLSILPRDGLIYGTAPTLTVCTQKGLSEEQLDLALNCVMWSMEMPDIVPASQSCTREKAGAVDVEAILSAAGVQFAIAQETDVTVPVATPETEPEATVEPFVSDEQPSAIGNEGAGFFGKWYALAIYMGGDVYSAADFGMSSELTLNEDGTWTMIDEDGERQGVWTLAGGAAQIDDLTFRLDENGDLYMEDDGAKLVYSRDANAEIPAAKPEEVPSVPTEIPASPTEVPVLPTEAPAQTPSEGAYSGQRLDVKFVCTSAESSGFTLQAAQLGGEYALTFHENGAVDFVVVGSALPGVTWKQLESGNFEIDYYGTMMEIVWTETGFDMNYFDTMLMHFAPEA